MRRLVCLSLLFGCALQADPSQQQGNTAIVIGAAGSGEVPGEPQALDVDLLRILVIGEFGVLTTEGDPSTGLFVLEIPPGPNRQIQVIGERNALPVLFGGTNVDIIEGQENQITIPVRTAGGLVSELLDTASSLLPIETLHLIALDAPLQMPQDYFIDLTEPLAPLPTGLYQIDPAQLPAGLSLPEGEENIILSQVGELLSREVVLLGEQEPRQISLSAEGLNLRVRILDEQGALAPFVGAVNLEDKNQLLNLPPLLSFSATDNGEKLLSNVLGSLPGLFGVAVITASTQDATRSTGTATVTLLDILPAGAPTRLLLIPTKTTLQGLPRPEPVDVVVAAVDALGRVSTNSNLTVTLSATQGALVRQSTVTLSQGVAVAKKALVPTGEATSITLKANASGFSEVSSVLSITQ